MDLNSLEKNDQFEAERSDSKVVLDEAEPAGWDAAFLKLTIRKVDIRVLPILALVYAVCTVDQANTAAAYVAGEAVDLGLTVGSRYSILTFIFFVPYILFEFPSIILVRKVKTSIWIGTSTVCWGIVVIGMGFVKYWWQMAICRVLLGFFEAGLFPACAYLISTWYTRQEIQKRMTGFFMLTVLIGGFSSAITAGISALQGKAGLGGWQWIFLLEGIVTILIGILAYLLVVDFPEKNKFLNADETKLIIQRLDKDRGDVEMDQWTRKKFFSYLRSPKLWGFGLLLYCGSTNAYAFSYFLPIILVGMGFNDIDAQLLVVPPYFGCILIAFGLAYLSDKHMIRAPIIMFQALLSIIGLCIVAYTTTVGVRYAGVFIGVCGTVPNMASMLGYMQNNIVGQTKRSYASALVIATAGIGGITATNVFRQQDYPEYRPGFWVSIGANILIIVLCGIMSIAFTIRNKQARSGRGPPIEGTEGFFYTI